MLGERFILSLLETYATGSSSALGGLILDAGAGLHPDKYAACLLRMGIDFPEDSAFDGEGILAEQYQALQDAILSLAETASTDQDMVARVSRRLREVINGRVQIYICPNRG